MDDSDANPRRAILAVFAHPDDETTSAAGTFIRYSREGINIHVVMATRGDKGSLGSDDFPIKPDELPAVREAELRSVLKLLGVRPPIILDYLDQELGSADFKKLVNEVVSVMEEVTPDVVITFGPTGISHHEDHIAIHRATVAAFHHYSGRAPEQSRLFYVAIPEALARQFDMDPHESETRLTVMIDIAADKAVKIRALRMYASQRDAQELADMFEPDSFEAGSFDVEGFHQAFPPLADDAVSSGFWD